MEEYRKIKIFFFSRTAWPILMSKKYVMGLKRGMFGKNGKFVALIWKSGISWRPTGGSFGWRWRGCVCSCYFSPNDLFEIFETQILLLEESHREASGRSLIADDFNSKSPEWGKARLDWRGILVVEMGARNDLIVLYQGRDFTFRRGAGGRLSTSRLPRPVLPQG